MNNEEKTAEELKDLGNVAVKNNKFAEAILYYSHGIKLEPNNFILFSNRSYAYLKLQHYYFALEDATKTIQLNPTGAKGYFRKAEVEYATKHYEDAIKSYQQMQFYIPHDEAVVKPLLLKAKCAYMADKKSQEQIPWVGSGIGIIIGVILIILDYIYTNKPTHPLLMAFVTIIISLLSYGIGKGYCYYDICQRDSLIQPPPNLFDDNEEKSNENENENLKNKSKLSSRSTKSQARQRYKRGKL